MSDEKKAADAAPEESVADKIDKNILRPVDELVKSIHSHDQTLRTIIAGWKRLWKQSKGRGQTSLTELVQFAAAMHGYVSLKSKQDVIVGQQIAADCDRVKFHCIALQNYLLERLIGGPEPVEEEGKPLRGREKRRAEEWKAARDAIDVHYKAQVEKEKERRAALVEKHKDEVLERSIQDMKRPEIKKEDDSDDKPKPTLVLPN